VVGDHQASNDSQAPKIQSLITQENGNYDEQLKIFLMMNPMRYLGI